MPIPPALLVAGGRNDKLVGNTPLIFTGDHARAEEFITQWQLYEGVNITNDLMRNAYQRAMLFLTYIQGPIVNEWVKGVNAWLRGQIITHQWAPTDKQLWNEVFNSFNRQFANVMEQEDASVAVTPAWSRLQAGVGLGSSRVVASKAATQLSKLARVNSARGFLSQCYFCFPSVLRPAICPPVHGIPHRASLHM
jgi:hypothetical protein